MTAEIIQFLPRAFVKQHIYDSGHIWDTYSNVENWNFDALTNTWTERPIGHPWPGEDKA